jgi:hypothetical protein
VWLELQDVYRDQVLQDVQGVNCEPAGGGSWDTGDIPDPTFVNQTWTPTTDPHEVGDHAMVKMTCNFSFLTPLVGSILGNPMLISATAEFPVKGGKIIDLPVLPEVSASPTPCGDDCCFAPDLSGVRVNSAPAVFQGTYGFDGTVIVTRPPNGNYSITSQNLVGGQEYACSTNIEVGGAT